MSALAKDDELEARLASLTRLPAGVEPGDLVDVVQSIVTSLEGDFTSLNVRFYAELESLSRFINETKLEIASLRPDEITDQHLPTATDELEAVIGATEQATNSIFEAVETIETLSESMDEETSAKIVDAVTMVYEACSFQDITGQRISKVVNALQHIEIKVQALLEAFGTELGDGGTSSSPAPAAKLGDERPDKDLMNGPQMPDAAVSQDDIDALFASLD